MKKIARRTGRARTSPRPELARARLQLARTRAVLANLNQQLRDNSAQLAASAQSRHVRDANEQLVISALNAQTAAEVAERSFRDDATLFERRARVEQRAKDALTASNAPENSRRRATRRWPQCTPRISSCPT
jgi:hypothetical protein